MSILHLNITDRDKNTSFHTERDYILSCNEKAELELNYSELLKILKKSVPLVQVDLSKHLKFQVVEWIQSVQRAISKGDVTSTESLQANAKIDYKLFSQLFELVDLEIQEDNRFNCRIKISNSLSPSNLEIDFNEQTIPHLFELQLEN